MQTKLSPEVLIASTKDTASFTHDIVSRLDLGIVVLDREYNVQLWNRFMALYSGVSSETILNKNLFHFFAEIPEKWFKKKIQSVFLLKTNAFVTWEQRQYIFQFRHNRPITGGTEFMAQNITLFPIFDEQNEVKQVAISLFDMTDVYVFRTQLQEANQQLEAISRTDGLTGIYNRAHLEELLKFEYNRSIRYNQPLALIMFDIDHFKKVNDTFGHLAGDEVIRAVAHAADSNIRGHDVLGRYGGEEFCVVLPATPLAGAITCAEKLRKVIENNSIEYHGEILKVTASFGVSVISASTNAYEKLLDAADAALYVSKRKGRNAVSTLYEVASDQA